MTIREKMNRKKVRIVSWILEMILLITVAFMYYLAQPIKTSVVLHIPSGSITAIITHLKAKKIDLTSVDKSFLRLIGEPQSGWIYMGDTTMSHADFLYKLTTAKAAMTEVTLIPGETTYEFSNQLADKFDLDAAKIYALFNSHSHYKEGSLVPDTYQLPIKIREKALVLHLLRHSALRHKEWSEKIFGNYDREKWEKYLIMASVIQKEAANKNEMPIVSSVIYNRLRKGMKLQMDGTLNYGEYSHVKVTAKRIRTDMSQYNTYKHKGLPPYPVCNVELSAIKAAIFPAKTEYLYFVKGKNGTHKFTRYYSTHIDNIHGATK